MENNVPVFVPYLTNLFVTSEIQYREVFEAEFNFNEFLGHLCAEVGERSRIQRSSAEFCFSEAEFGGVEPVWPSSRFPLSHHKLRRKLNQPMKSGFMPPNSTELR